MPHATFQTPEGWNFERELAGPGSRFAAGLIDLAWIAAALISAVLVLALAAGVDRSGLTAFLGGVLAAGALLAVAAFQALFGVRAGGATPGKRALGLRVVSADGRPASATQHVLRALLWPLDALLPVPLPFGLLGIFSMLATDKRQRLGDLVAGTLVLREGRARARSASPHVKRAEPGPPLETAALAAEPGLVARLNGADRALIADLLARQGLDPEMRRRLFVDVARHYAAELELGSFRDARVVLRDLHTASNGHEVPPTGPPPAG